MTDIVKLYANSLFEFAVANKKATEIAKEMQYLSDICTQDPSILSDLSAPIYSDNEQIELISKIVKALKLSKTVSNFLDLLVENKRMLLLAKICKEFDIIFSSYEGYKLIQVTVSEELSTKEKDQIQQKLEKGLSSKVKIDFKIEPEILGGIIIKVDSKIFDASLASRFAHLRMNIDNEIAFL